MPLLPSTKSIFFQNKKVRISRNISFLHKENGQIALSGYNVQDKESQKALVFSKLLFGKYIDAKIIFNRSCFFLHPEIKEAIHDLLTSRQKADTKKINCWVEAIEESLDRNAFDYEFVSAGFRSYLLSCQLESLTNGIESIIDLGGGRGTFALQLASRLTSVKKILVIEPHEFQGRHLAEHFHFSKRKIAITQIPSTIEDFIVNGNRRVDLVMANQVLHMLSTEDLRDAIEFAKGSASYLAVTETFGGNKKPDDLQDEEIWEILHSAKPTKIAYLERGKKFPDPGACLFFWNNTKIKG